MKCPKPCSHVFAVVKQTPQIKAYNTIENGLTHNQVINQEGTAEDGMAGFQSQFKNFHAKINQR